MKNLIFVFIFLYSCDVRTDKTDPFVVKSVEYLRKSWSKSETIYYDDVYLYNGVLTSSTKYSIGDTLVICKIN